MNLVFFAEPVEQLVVKYLKTICMSYNYAQLHKHSLMNFDYFIGVVERHLVVAILSHFDKSSLQLLNETS